MSGAYYNEIDPFAAEWLRQLIKAGHIADGEVDERSIEQVGAADLAGFTQCHFFAGIGVWSHALRLAGWPDTRPVWTGSCPCPSFSVAGKGQGFNDPRHLWPAWFRLIAECRPATVFGEQVDAAIRYGWLDLVQHQMESQGYAVGKVVLSAAGVGAPHIRKRLYFVAQSERNQEHQEQQRPEVHERERSADSVGGRSTLRGLADAEHAERRPLGQHREDGRDGQDSRRPEAHSEFGTRGEVRELDDTASARRKITREYGSGSPPLGSRSEQRSALRGLADSRLQRQAERQKFTAGLEQSGERRNGVAQGDTEQPGLEGHAGDERDGREPGRLGADAAGPVTAAGVTRGFWRDAEWLWCRDGKYRPVEPKYVKVASGVAGGMGNNWPLNSKSKEEEMNASPEINRDGQGELRNLRQGERVQTSRSPQGSESRERRSKQLTDFVRLLPPSLTLAKLHGDTATAEALQALLEAVGAPRALQYTPYEAEAIWRSAPKEVQDRIWLGITQGEFVRTTEHPLASGITGRVGLLRGYGNAIAAPAAQAFIETYMRINHEQPADRLKEMG